MSTQRTATILADGISFGEGPRWREGRLWFSDFYDHAVKSVTATGEVRVELEIDDQPSGLGWTPDGDLLVVSMTKRQVLRRTPDGQIRVHADLNGVATWFCNDMVVDAQGRAYVGNFGFDLAAGLADRGFEGVIAEHPAANLALVSPDGAVSLAADDMHFPNGSVITPDGRTLIVAETLGLALTAFDIGADGRLSNRRIWASTGARVPDGIALDAEGCVWVANAGGHECVRIAEGGEVREVIDPGDTCYACMLGGDDGRTLFMLTAPALTGEGDGDARPKGRLVIAKVDAPHAGRP
jgi:sugar lactone lactonase YvrE